MRYVGYVRISSEEQRGNYSLAAQKHSIQSWVTRQQGLRAGVLLQVYEDRVVCFTGLIDNGQFLLPMAAGEAYQENIHGVTLYV